jgi:hypothetical protein
MKVERLVALGLWQATTDAQQHGLDIQHAEARYY